MRPLLRHPQLQHSSCEPRRETQHLWQSWCNSRAILKGQATSLLPPSWAEVTTLPRFLRRTRRPSPFERSRCRELPRGGRSRHRWVLRLWSRPGGVQSKARPGLHLAPRGRRHARQRSSGGRAVWRQLRRPSPCRSSPPSAADRRPLGGRTAPGHRCHGRFPQRAVCVPRRRRGKTCAVLRCRWPTSSGMRPCHRPRSRDRCHPGRTAQEEAASGATSAWQLHCRSPCWRSDLAPALQVRLPGAGDSQPLASGAATMAGLSGGPTAPDRRCRGRCPQHAAPAMRPRHACGRLLRTCGSFRCRRGLPTSRRITLRRRTGCQAHRPGHVRLQPRWRGARGASASPGPFQVVPWTTTMPGCTLEMAPLVVVFADRRGIHLSLRPSHRSRCARLSRRAICRRLSPTANHYGHRGRRHSRRGLVLLRRTPASCSRASARRAHHRSPQKCRACRRSRRWGCGRPCGTTPWTPCRRGSPSTSRRFRLRPRHSRHGPRRHLRRVRVPSTRHVRREQPSLRRQQLRHHRSCPICRTGTSSQH